MTTRLDGIESVRRRLQIHETETTLAHATPDVLSETTPSGGDAVVRLEVWAAGDVVEIEAAPFSLPLRNRLIAGAPDMVTVRTL